MSLCLMRQGVVCFVNFLISPVSSCSILIVKNVSFHSVASSYTGIILSSLHKIWLSPSMALKQVISITSNLWKQILVFDLHTGIAE